MFGQLSIEWKWIFTAVVIGSGLLILWALYEAVLYKLSWGKSKTSVAREAECVGNKSEVLNEEIVMPFTGRLRPITEVPDPIFSEKMVGDGFAIEPISEVICSPVSGVVMQIYSNRDAITLRTKSQHNVILHIGIDSSKLKGEGITIMVSEGEEVEAGQKLGEIDLKCIVPFVRSVISPVVFPDLKEDEYVELRKTGSVEAGTKGAVVLKKRAK